MAQIAAFFDMDLTLLSVNSASLWLKHMWRQGDLRPLDAARSLGWLARYKMGMLDMTQVTRRGLSGLAGRSEEEMRQEVLRWYREQVQRHLYQEGRELVERHRAQGHRLVLLTGSSPYISQPVVQELGLDHFLCTRLEVIDGLFTGRPIEPVCYGDGKRVLAEELAAQEDLDLDRSWFYTDSYTDLPMLRRVGHPVATNPDPRLARLARREGMQVLRLSH